MTDLAALGAAWDKLGSIPEHAAWGRELEPLVVSSSARWTVFRVL